MDSIDDKILGSFKKELQKDKSYVPLQRSVTANGIFKSLSNIYAGVANTTVFSHEVETDKVTNQKESGRCWLFAVLNVLRHEIAKNYKIEDFELSQSYSFFWDKLEKSNLFYEQMIELAGLPLDDRKVDFLISSPQSDGGWWEGAVSIIKKYGLVPKDVMPDPVTMEKTREINLVLNRKLRKDCLVLRGLVKDSNATEARQAKQGMLSEIYKMLVIAFGEPPQEFSFAYKDKDKKYHRDISITPKQFLSKYSSIDLDEYVTIGNDPRPEHPYNEPYVIKEASHSVDGTPLMFINAEINVLIDLAARQVKNGELVWFGCDVFADVNDKGFMSDNLYDFDALFGTDFDITKAERLATHDTSPNHAMTLTGVDIVDNKPVQWKVENSWGKKVGKEGYYTMDTDWFAKNVYTTGIKKSYLSPELLKALDKTPKVLPIWDSMA